MSPGTAIALPAGPLARIGRRLGRALTGLAVGGALALQGCAPVAGVDADDFCSQHRAVMVKEQERFNETIAIGAISGAIAGGIIGGLASGDVTGALIGAVVGGATGALGGYLTAKSRQGRNRAEILNAINQDVRATRGFVTQLSESVRRLNTCRANEVNDLSRRIQSGQLSGEAARAELAVLRQRIADDRRLVNQVIGEVDENRGVFADALAKTSQVDRDIVVSSRVQSYQPQTTSYTSSLSAGTVLESPGGRTRYASAGVNVRTGPGTEFDKMGVFYKGQRVGYLGDAGGGWSRVSVPGGEGFVASKYLATSRPSSGSQVAAAPPKATGKFEPPRVEARAQPRASSDIDELTIQASNLKAEDQAFEAAVSQELDALEALAA
ncbi:hypothetical protein LNKW23_45590 [Paralimibaculum aggregatum]|uniref:SH3b domain-containing protein n=1 Tax=Paralimibaculum aggregatum TaxID=3036245 RepID=A0ABQ6LTC7_9RHOB|nr:SH3 domain-containing protein [Limibaculum sp. NKW23]GMG85339.1 hypothetical protein LNKW23_45590 [Limibaculum sp. NKW23]